MKAEFLHEPELEFGIGKHVDIKFGLMNYGPLDFDSLDAPKKIRLGIVGTPETNEGVMKWIEKCRTGIDAKQSKRPNLFPRFPGFGVDTRLCADFIIENRLQRPIPSSQFHVLCEKHKTDDALEKIARLYLEEIEDLVEKTTVEVVVCAFPFELVEYLDQDNEWGKDTTEEDMSEEEGVQRVPSRMIFHDFLKAKAMQFRKPTQIIRPATYDDRKRLKRKHSSGEKRELQDEATRAWNFYTALYYKAGGTPWRLLRDHSQLDTCYIGVSFFKSLDETKLLTSTAQIFNERGEGIIVRGGTAHISKDDKQVHLSDADAYALLKNALENYRREHRNFPARVVVHKSSVHDAGEIDGFERALRTCSIDTDQADFTSVTRTFSRLFRAGLYPPLRGTLWEADEQHFILYTRGSVDFFNAYPGLYVPRPLRFRCDKIAQTPSFVAKEILALTKMNWNNAQFDGGDPITIRAARQVGSMLKYLDADHHYEPSYKFYM